MRDSASVASEIALFPLHLFTDMLKRVDVNATFSDAETSDIVTEWLGTFSEVELCVL